MFAGESEGIQLIVHIGTGRTGSSSIQATLAALRDKLLERRIAYLGIMLEYAQPHVYGWQIPEGSDDFFVGLAPGAACEQAYTVLRESLIILQRQGFTHAVWSNEWMFGRHEYVLPALERLRAEGFSVTVVCYLRRHDDWVRSSYIQWGIKHKTYQGVVKPFREWKVGRTFSFFQPIKPWCETFGFDFRLRNLDAVGDVVLHFLKEIEADLGQVVPVRENASPSGAVLSAWSVYNSRFIGEVRPDAFVSAAQRLGLGEACCGVHAIEELLPSREELESIEDEYSMDIADTNAILVAQSQSPLDQSTIAPLRFSADLVEIQRMVLNAVYCLDEKVMALEALMQLLKERTGLSDI